MAGVPARDQPHALLRAIPLFGVLDAHAVDRLAAALEHRSFPEGTVGLYHVCGLTLSGEGECWGQALLGALGDGGTDNYGGPRPVAGGLTFSQKRV